MTPATDTDLLLTAYRDGLNFPADGITVFTTGPVSQLEKLSEENLDIRLAEWFCGRNVIINLPEFNETAFSPLRKADYQTMAEFKRQLEYTGIEVKVNAD